MQMPFALPWLLPWPYVCLTFQPLKKKTVPKGWIKEGAPYRRSRGPPTVK